MTHQLIKNLTWVNERTVWDNFQSYRDLCDAAGIRWLDFSGFVES